MKRLKQALALILALCLALSLASCGSDSGSGGFTASKADNSSSEASEESTGGDGGNDGEPANNDEVTTLSMFINHTWYPVDSFTGIIPEEITKATGVNLDVTVAVDSNQLGVQIASGELQDIVYTQDLLDRLSDPEVCYSYEDLIEEYNVDWDIDPKQLGIARTYSQDGKAYTVLNHYSDTSDWTKSSGVPMVGTLVYRYDLWNEIGSPSMNNLDEMYDALTKVKEKHPDIVPLKINENWNIESFRDQLGMGAIKYIEQDDGTWQHYSRDPRYRDLLLWLNKCYLNGYVIADDPFFVKGSTAITDDGYFISATCTQNGYASTNGTLQAIDPSYEVREMKPFDTASYPHSDLGWSASFISKNNKNPDLSIKFIQYMFTPEAQALTQMGREGIDYTLNEEGLPEFSQDWLDATAADTLKVDYNIWFYLGGSATVEAESRMAVLDPKWYADAAPIERERYSNLPWIEAARPKGEIDEKIIEDKVFETLSTYEQKIILAGSAEEAASLYDEYIGIIDQAGMAKVESYITEKIKEVMPMFQ